MPSSATVKADILENHHAAQHIDGSLDPQTPLALKAPFKMIHFLVRHSANQYTTNVASHISKTPSLSRNRVSFPKCLESGPPKPTFTSPQDKLEIHKALTAWRGSCRLSSHVPCISPARDMPSTTDFAIASRPGPVRSGTLPWLFLPSVL